MSRFATQSTIDLLIDQDEDSRLNKLRRKTRAVSKVGDKVRAPAPLEDEYEVTAKGADKFLKDVQTTLRNLIKDQLESIKEAEEREDTGMTVKEMKEMAKKQAHTKIEPLLDWFERTFPADVFNVIHSKEFISKA